VAVQAVEVGMRSDLSQRERAVAVRVLRSVVGSLRAGDGARLAINTRKTAAPS